MKKAFLHLLLLLLAACTARAQSIEGVWYSESGERTYLIAGPENKTTLLASAVKDDSTGKVIIEKLEKKGDKYRGIISAPGHSISTAVVIKQKKEKQVLVLRLERMLVLDIIIKWYRTPPGKNNFKHGDKL